MIVYVLKYGPSDDIETVEFQILDTETVKKLSVLEVTDATIYARGLPNMNGINDVRMGTVDRRLMCCTCGRDVKTCAGHIGHINLPVPCFHIGFIDMCMKTLRCVCFMCSKLGLSESDAENLQETQNKHRFTAVYGICRNRKKCSCCGAPQPAYNRTPSGIRVDWPSDAVFDSPEEEEFAKQPFTASSALSILTSISDDDAKMMGFGESHPRNLVIETVVVAPPVARPAIMVSEGSRAKGQDDLTHKLQDINKRCIEIRNTMAKTATSVPRTLDAPHSFDADMVEKISKLQLEVFSFMNSSIKAPKRQTNKSVTAIKSVSDRLKGKEGRIRGNLMGKRVDQSARSVITPDAIMDPDEVGVPYSIATSVTVPERVSSSNIDHLTRRVQNGPNNIDGAESVVTLDGTVIHLEFCQSRHSLRLQYGWVVERYLQDNDYVIFNRQPSLHKMGMMGHRVKLMPGSTFRLNLCCASPYNADFDGDEMNMHVPQSNASMSEVFNIMAVPQQIISPASNKPVMGIVQDTLLGSYLMTRDDVFITRSVAMRLVGWIRYPRCPWYELLPDPAVLHPEELWTGRQIFSTLFATDINYKKGNIEIRDGMLISGTMSKQTLGTSTGSLIDYMYRQYGSHHTINFMGDIQRLVNQWLLTRGFSVGIGDCALSATGHEAVRERIDQATKNIYAIHDEPIREEQLPFVEQTTLSILSKILMNVGGIVEKEMATDNAIKSMVSAGAKGNPINLSQICGCVGQQSVEGGRTCSERGTTISMFKKDSYEVESKGFVSNSYALGLTPNEYFFHAMGGREGLVDTAVKTATTGYIQRRLIKGMEDNKVEYDGSVRNAEGAIVQFVYGVDGGDPCKLEKISVPEMDWDDEKLCALTDDPAELEMIKDLRNVLWTTRMRAHRGLVDITLLTPVNIDREMFKITRQEFESPPLTVEESNRLLNGLCDRVKTHRGDNETVGIRLWIRVRLCSGVTVQRRRLNVEQMRRLCERIYDKMNQSQVSPGEMVGSVAAQSIGEPCTQMTLNTFHLAGVGNQLTLGVPRFKELIDLAKTIRTPSMLLTLRGDMGKDKQYAKQLANTIVQTKLLDIVSSTTFLYEPDQARASIAEDQIYVDLHQCLYGPQPDFSSWVARMVLKKDVMAKRKLTPSNVHTILQHQYGGRIQWIASETNSLEWILRMRIAVSEKIMSNVAAVDDPEKILLQRIHSDILDDMHICGMKKITGASVREIEMSVAPSVVETRYLIETHGISVFCATFCNSVDINELVINDVSEAYDIFGIEAAAAVLFREIETTISFDGTYVDKRHIMQIVDTMTFRGFVMPLSRHGINRVDQGPMMRSSFEETVDIMYDAAMFNEKDNGRGVTQSIMTGQLAKMGTGCFTVRVPLVNVANKKSAGSKLCKSRVRMQLDMDTRNAIEFVNRDTWDARANTDVQCERPFVDTRPSSRNDPFMMTSVVDERQASSSSATQFVYGHGTQMERIDTSYRPPSPSY